MTYRCPDCGSFTIRIERAARHIYWQDAEGFREGMDDDHEDNDSELQCNDCYRSTSDPDSWDADLYVGDDE